MHYILFYELASDYLGRRGQFRAEHLRLARESYRRGDLVLADALADPVDNAVLVFGGRKPEAPEGFAKSDPYVKNGLITSVRQEMDHSRGRRIVSSMNPSVGMRNFFEPRFPAAVGVPPRPLF